LIVCLAWQIYNFIVDGALDTARKENVGEPRASHEAPLTERVIPDSKGSLFHVPVVIKGQERLQYAMRLNEKMPTFNFLPRGREIIHRLILRAAMAKGTEEFAVYRTNREALESLIFKKDDQ